MEYVAAALVFCIGVVFFVAFIPDFFRSLGTHRWIRVEGVVTHSSISKSERTDGPPSYFPEVQYSYEYQGQHFVGNRIGMVRTGARYSGYAKDTLKHFVKGSKVPVYVDPTHPRRAVLKPGISWGCLLASLFGVGAMTFAIFVWSGTN